MAIESANAKDEIPMENHAYTALGWWREKLREFEYDNKNKEKKSNGSQGDQLRPQLHR